MSDIFEIKGVQIFLKIGSGDSERNYKFSDPKFIDKVLLKKELKKEKLKYESGDLDQEDYMIKMDLINKKLIKQYLPDLPDDYLENLGEFETTALLNKIHQLADLNFGAIVEKIEKK